MPRGVGWQPAGALPVPACGHGQRALLLPLTSSTALLLVPRGYPIPFQ
jgi:hypothetical protein